MPRVTVILPNYNYARYLKERVRTILGQTMADFELLYVDDASTDASNRVVAPFAADPRVTLRLHDQNSGTVYQRWNDAAAGATGEWLWFPNADDAAHPRFLERLLRLVEGRPSVGMVHCQLALIDGNGRVVATQLPAGGALAAHLAADRVTPGSEEVVRLAEGRYLRTASAVLFRRNVFAALGGFDARLWGVADYDLYLRLLHRHDVAYVAEPLASYREHGGNTTRVTPALTLDLGFAYAFAGALKRMTGDPRYTPAMRQAMRRHVRARLFDVFVDPAARIPAPWRFVLEDVYEVEADPRLRAALTATQTGRGA
jgi:glycosyltransferase involved in cell wall biosynthesis